MNEEHARYVQEGLPLARAVAKRIAATLPPHIPFDDLLAAGHEGLVHAASRYDPSRNARFTTFAYYHVRGAILDHVRQGCRDDPATRLRSNAERSVDALITERLDGAPPPESPAAAAVTLAGLLGELAAAFSLAEVAVATVTEPPTPDPETAALHAQRGAHLHTALEHLPDLERAILQRVYFEGMSIAEAGEALGMSRSWANRVHARALSALREKLDPVADAL
jgi:RNA polymerase sigma factor for flagellar operon FliA